MLYNRARFKFKKTMLRPVPLFISLILLSLFSILLALSTGSQSLSLHQLFNSLFVDQHGLAHDIVWQLRIPRAYVAFISGGLLALAGALMQVLLRNPLADPYILGVSGGASVAVLIAMTLGLSSAWLSGSAFLGALLAMLLVFGLSRSSGWHPTRLLLTGVVVAAGWGALINFILSLSAEKPLRSMLFWLMGDISHQALIPGSGLVLLLALIASLVFARRLNILAQGELQAAALGLAVKPLRIALFVSASLLTAFAVIQAGSVGFIGLVVPHMLRLISGSDHRHLLPASALLGGSLLLISDTLARSLFAPQQLPVGVITAFIGVPWFLYLLNRQSTRQIAQ